MKKIFKNVLMILCTFTICIGIFASNVKTVNAAAGYVNVKLVNKSNYSITCTLRKLSGIRTIGGSPSTHTVTIPAKGSKIVTFNLPGTSAGKFNVNYRNKYGNIIDYHSVKISAPKTIYIK